MNKLSYKSTRTACYFGYVTQAVGVNLPPLLFVIFSTRYGVSLEKIALLISVNFILQMLTDLAASKFAVKIGYRVCSVLAHSLSLAGLILLGVLPGLMPPYAGLLVSFVFLAVGGGLIEVLVSPVVDALPSSNSAGSMSLLHSFYCWGMVAVVLLTTLFFTLFGMEYWFILPLLWGAVPLCGAILFLFVPFPPREEETKTPYKKLLSSAAFWLLLILMLAAGAAEQAIAQWASLFAELGLGVSKTAGDLLGPCMFAVLMGVSRVLYGIFGKRLNLRLTLCAAGALTLASYALTVFSPDPFVSLIGCGLCGLGVGIAWPGVLSLASAKLPGGGTPLFALLALGGDIGCAAGPGLVGFVSGLVSADPTVPPASWFGSTAAAGLKSGLIFAAAFPVLLIVGVLLLRTPKKAASLPLTRNTPPSKT